MKEWKSYLGGEWISTGDVRDAVRTYDQASLGRLHLCGPEQMETAILRASEAFAETRKLTSAQRHQILIDIHAGISARKEEFARSISDESGKPIRDARVEVDRALLVFSLSADESRRIGGELLPLDLNAASAGRIGLTRRFPIGPIGGITPFNFPLNLTCHKVGPAIAAGNPIVLKPAERTPITALMLAEVVEQTAWPKGAFSAIAAKEAKLGEIFATDPRIKMLSFTGAAGVGWRLKQMASHKRVALELGGNGAVIVHGDADLGLALSRCLVGAFSNAGQVCISVQRIYVHRPIWDDFVPRFVDGARKLELGDPGDDATTFTPMISEEAAAKAQKRVDDAIAQGAKALLLGKREGARFEPVVLTDTKPSMMVCGEEVFAPVVVVEPYDEFADALDLVNEGDFGLQAGVFTRDVGRLFQAFSTLEVGGVIGNDIPTYRIDNMPYGGEKDSGFGREGVRYAIDEMTELRLLALNLV
jgi:glyceraldehyde-3-phosphate dehydrogenase (NADP+)